MATNEVALTPLQFEILRDAVNIARDRQIQTKEVLRSVLLQRWPKKPKSVNAAIVFWANQERRKRR